MAQYSWLEDYLLSKSGCTKDYKHEWSWWRWLVGGKMFAARCKPGPKHKIYQERELLTLKCEPDFAALLRAEYPEIVPGFYMDKRNWISIFLDGALPDEVLRDLCDRSYALVFGKLTKKMQQALSGAL